MSLTARRVRSTGGVEVNNMSVLGHTLLDRIPGDIPALLLQWSPLRLQDGTSSVVLELDGDHVEVFARPTNCWSNAEAGRVRRDCVELDLTDATGRAHAAAWIHRHQTFTSAERLAGADYAVFLPAQDFSDMTPEQIDTLARLVLRLAGREA